jgi:hypothetical protein
VLITGESGTGKELVAGALHRLSRRPGELVTVNVAGLDDTLFGDTLFGHTRGAFTSAERARAGLIEAAADGTTFLDEIGDLSASAQVKLLRLLQNGTYYALGADGPRGSRARVIAATNCDLAAAVADGRFRRDLYYRLRTHHLDVPPLRARRDDLPLLVSHFVDVADARETGCLKDAGESGHKLMFFVHEDDWPARRCRAALTAVVHPRAACTVVARALTPASAPRHPDDGLVARCARTRSRCRRRSAEGNVRDRFRVGNVNHPPSLTAEGGERRALQVQCRQARSCHATRATVPDEHTARARARVSGIASASMRGESTRVVAKRGRRTAFDQVACGRAHSSRRHRALKKGRVMNIGRVTLAAWTVVMSLSSVPTVRGQQTPDDDAQVAGEGGGAAGTLVRTVRQATGQLQDEPSAVAAGYALSGGCVSGPEEGAMGVHFVNATLVGDGTLDATRPEALVFEPQGGALKLAAVEYLVLAEQWNEANDHPPVLNGQHFHFVGAPNRSGLPPYYELHVWAWKRNPHGTFADWNPNVRCDTYTPR